VFSDDTTQAPDLPGGADLLFIDEAGLGARRDAVVRLTWTARVVSNAVRLRDYNPETPKVVLDESATVESGDLERYDAPARFPDPQVGARRARHRLEAEGATARVLRGEAGTIRLLPGFLVHIDGHPLPSLG